MSIELRLLPVDRWPSGIEGTCHTVLNAPQDYRMFDEIRATVPERLPRIHNFTGHFGSIIEDGTHKGEHGYGKLVSDAYGEPYQWMPASELGPILHKHYPAHPVSAYVMAMPPDDMIVLDWH